MYARSVRMKLKPNSVAVFTHTIEKEVIPLLRKQTGFEHRRSMRKPATFHVTLSYPPLGLLRSKVRDISLDGMFIETGPIALHANTPVEVMVRLQKGNTRDAYRLRALVVRVARDGAGLMFDDATSRAARDLLLKSSAAGETNRPLSATGTDD